MKTLVLLILLGAAGLMTGCSTVGRRIGRNQAVFDTYPPATQAKIRARKIEVGFSKKMVEIAIGRPDRVYTRTSSAKLTRIWAYVDHGPTFSVGIGFGSGNYHHGGYMGFSTVLVDGDRYDRYERLRIEFDGEVVAAFEEVNRRR